MSNRGSMLQEAFFEAMVSERTRLFCPSTMDRLHVQCSVRGLPLSRAGHVVLFLIDTLTRCMGWLNQKIVLQALGRPQITIADLYRYLSIMLLSHCTGFSFVKSIDILHTLGSSTPSLEIVRFISGNIMAYSATGRGNDRQSSWNSQRDQTSLLTTFEKTAFSVTCKVFLNPNHLFATLDDDLCGTRASDNQVKTLSARKADEERHTADAIADVLSGNFGSTVPATWGVTNGER